ncbi:uncharacterized protein LOC107368048 isoform X2 [Tetranychus urticae]|uniref:uncharacterized protein LOC107368048 isoform X2 n=1 Tax=Tetranychus urticae TaxID=32264 RepID=UPI00077B9796|nr:uncharacterized protein LOC107368048 isoform X2 [Tetranychus urticae]
MSIIMRLQLIGQMKVLITGNNCSISYLHTQAYRLNNKCLYLCAMNNLVWVSNCADWNTRLVTKEHAMSVFQDGDCFLLETLMYKNGAPNISCVYRLVHRDVATEFGCNLDYCHYLCRRSFSRRISEIIKAYQSQHILDPMAHGQTEEERQRSKEAVYDDHYREIMSIVHAHPAPYNCIIRDLAFSISKQDVEVKFQIYIASRRDPNKYEALKWLEYNKY